MSKIRLTGQELKTANLTMIRGLSSKLAAEKLNVSKRTVDFHLANIYDKCGVNSKAEACRMLNMEGILSFSKLHDVHESMDSE